MVTGDVAIGKADGGGLWRQSGIMQVVVTGVRAVWARYNSALATHPLLTKVATGTCIYASGDVTMQRLEARSASSGAGASPRTPWRWDAARTARMCAYGGLWLSPFLHNWYRVLDKMVIGTGLRALAPKLALDQTLAAGANMVMFFTITKTLEGQTPAQVRDTLRDRLWPTMLSLWCVWPAVQLVNFTLVPLHRRVLVVNLVGVGWSTYLSYVGNRQEEACSKIKSKDEVAVVVVGEGREVVLD